MANTDPVRVGVLFSRAGTTSRVELSQLLGTFFAIREINDSGGIDGRELVAVHYDPQCVPQRYRALAVSNTPVSAAPKRYLRERERLLSNVLRSYDSIAYFHFSFSMQTRILWF